MSLKRTPWFCPKCNKTMKSHLDDKMYRLYGHCFDCQVKFERERTFSKKVHLKIGKDKRY